MVPELPGINQPIHISYLYPGSRTAITQIEQMRCIPSYIRDRESDSYTALQSPQLFPLVVMYINFISFINISILLNIVVVPAN
jgi:hypothetical protein